MGRILPSLAGARPSSLRAEDTLTRFPTPQRGEFQRVQHALSCERHQERMDDLQNARVRAKFGALSQPEPKSIHAAAPTPPTMRIPPAKRADPVAKGAADTFFPARDPEKRHPWTKLDPWLTRFYGK